jgi:hypothetical protein
MSTRPDVPAGWENDEDPVHNLVYRMLVTNEYKEKTGKKITNTVDMLYVFVNEALLRKIRAALPHLTTAQRRGFEFERLCKNFFNPFSSYPEILVKKKSEEAKEYDKYREIDMFFMNIEPKTLPKDTFQFIYPKYETDYVMGANTCVFGECKLSFPYNKCVYTLDKIMKKLFHWFLPFLEVADNSINMEIILLFNHRNYGPFLDQILHAIHYLNILPQLSANLKLKICYVKESKLRALLHPIDSIDPEPDP